MSSDPYEGEIISPIRKSGQNTLPAASDDDLIIPRCIAINYEPGNAVITSNITTGEKFYSPKLSDEIPPRFSRNELIALRIAGGALAGAFFVGVYALDVDNNNRFVGRIWNGAAALVTKAGDLFSESSQQTLSSPPKPAPVAAAAIGTVSPQPAPSLQSGIGEKNHVKQAHTAHQ